MRACFPVAHDHGLESRVHPHFGSAPMFLMVDTETHEVRVVVNGACEHQHGHCQPLAALARAPVDAVVVGGIGPGALDRLRSASIAVYRAPQGTVREVLDEIARGLLSPVDVLAGSGKGLGCGGLDGDHHQHRHHGP